MHNKILSYLDSRSGISISFPISTLHLKVTPSFSKISKRLSITFFSSLKSGIPYLSKPPILSSLSYTVTL